MMLDVVSNGNGAIVLLALIAIGAIGMVVMATLLGLMWRRQTGANNEREELKQALLLVKSEQRHALTMASLAPLYEKVNDLGKDVADMRAALRANTEQLRVIYRYIMRSE